MSEKSFDHLKILSKHQIIDFLKNEYFLQAPNEKKVKLFLYDILIKDHFKKIDDNLNDKSSSIAANKADELAIKINSEKDLNKKLELLSEREKHVDVIRENMKTREKLDKEYKKIQRLIE